MDNQIMAFREQLSKSLSTSRFDHSLSVSFTGTALAMCYGADLIQAETAGILHDCAKCYSDRTLTELCRQKGIELTPDELLAPAVIHARYGAWMAEHEYGITDTEVLSAIRWHTTGCAKMSTQAKILFIADYIEPRRDKAPGLPRLRKLAFKSLDETMYEILAGNLEYLNNKGKYIDSRSREAYEFYAKYHK